jgi:peptidoglycan/xylan/chitin deacetylase (PgdA/CDA1 family)
MNPTKLLLAKVLDATGASSTLIRSQRMVFGPHLRAVNYHDVPPSRASDFERQLELLAKLFHCMTRADADVLARGEWPHAKPGLVLSFDDGLRSHAEVCAPLLERHGLTGWFMVPFGFVEEPPGGQLAFARDHLIDVVDEWGDCRVAMTWPQVRSLADRHVIGCHGWGHRRLADALTDAELDHEIQGAKAALERAVGRSVDVFAWIGGEESAYSQRAAARIQAAGFRFSFMTNHAVYRPGADTLQVQRTNLEADYPLSVVRFHLSGFMDVMYTAKRRRVNRLTKVEVA